MLAIEATCCRIVRPTCGNIDNKAQTTHSILHSCIYSCLLKLQILVSLMWRLLISDYGRHLIITNYIQPTNTTQLNHHPTEVTVVLFEVHQEFMPCVYLVGSILTLYIELMYSNKTVTAKRDNILIVIKHSFWLCIYYVQYNALSTVFTHEHNIGII